MVAAPAHLLLVEDDDGLAQLLVEYLGPRGFQLTRVASGDEGARAIVDLRPDLVILDLMLPGVSGLDICRRIRARYDGAILMLTASKSEADHVAGLELGADDFVTKPIEPRVLLARIRTQLRRREGSAPRHEGSVFKVGELAIDVDARRVSVADTPLELTSMELEILTLLAREAGAVVPRDQLYRQILGVDYDGLDRGMDVHVSRIRKKLRRAGLPTGQLSAVRGVGYMLTKR